MLTANTIILRSIKRSVKDSIFEFLDNKFDQEKNSQKVDDTGSSYELIWDEYEIIEYLILEFPEIKSFGNISNIDFSIDTIVVSDFGSALSQSVKDIFYDWINYKGLTFGGTI